MRKMVLFNRWQWASLWALFLILIPSLVSAQPKAPYTWKAELYPKDVRAGESAQLRFTVKVDPTWHIYQVGQTGGPQATLFEILKGTALVANGKILQPTPIIKQDPNFGIEVGLFEGETVFALPVQVAANAKGKVQVTTRVTSQACDDTTCDLPRRQEINVSFTVSPGKARPDRIKPMLKVPDQPKKDGESQAAAGKTTSGASPPPTSGSAADDFASKVKEKEGQGILPFMLFAFSMGLLALLTPCVFPMIPITVSFFSKQGTPDAQGKTKPNYGGASSYCLGIIGTFTGIGLLMTILFGATGINRLATNPWVNLALALLFLVLAANLFGLFEIKLPSGFVNKVGSKGKATSFIGAILMGLTFSLTSFTCTVPFVGTILAAAANGEYLYPTLGMLAFSTAFALPFFLLALFPSALAKLPKSGSWLSTTKAFMGFIEIAAALKFLSNTDLVFQLGILTRPVFLAIWAATFLLAGLYLLGWIRLGHESDSAKLGWLRRGFGVATIAIAGYCLAGIQGRPLGELSSFLPPQPYPFKSKEGGQPTMVAGAISWIESFEEAKKAAQAQSRPIFLNFTGVTCTNCRWMEDNMFTRPEIRAAMDQYVLAHLYTDRFTPEDEANQKLQLKLTNQSTLPVYVIVNPDGSVERITAFTRSESEFLEFLKPRSMAQK